MFPVAAPDNLDESAAGFSACGDIFFADVGEGGSGGGGCSLDVSSLGTFGARLNDRLRRIELPRDLIEVGAAGGTVSAEGSASDMRCEDSADACGGCRAFVRLKDSTLLMPFMVPAMARGAGCAEFQEKEALISARFGGASAASRCASATCCVQQSAEYWYMDMY